MVPRPPNSDNCCAAAQPHAPSAEIRARRTLQGRRELPPPPSDRAAPIEGLAAVRLPWGCPPGDRRLPARGEVSCLRPLVEGRGHAVPAACQAEDVLINRQVGINGFIDRKMRGPSLGSLGKLTLIFRTPRQYLDELLGAIRRPGVHVTACIEAR